LLQAERVPEEGGRAIEVLDGQYESQFGDWHVAIILTVTRG
jgi:hypothetical protein